MFKYPNPTFLLILMMLCHTCIAQSTDDCELTLNRATEEFNAGHFYGIDSLLNTCIKHGFTKEQRQRAYLLLTQAYLLLDAPRQAEASYLALLKANPEFVTDASRDPIEVVYLSKKFTSSPLFSVSARLGGNTSFVHVLKYLNISGEPVNTDYVLRPGWTFLLEGDYHVNEKISIGVELQYAYTAYKRQQYGLWTTSSTEIIDKQNWVNIPVLASYFHNMGRITPYGYAGYSVNFLLRDQVNISLFDKNFSSDQTITPSESPILNYGYKRNFFSSSLLFGVGVQYKWGLEYLFADIRYSLGLKNLFDYSGAYFDYSKGSVDHANNHADYTLPSLVSSGDPVFEYSNLDNYFRLNTVYLTVGYRHPLYKPRKLKKARTKSVLRDIRKGKNEGQ